MPVVRHLQPETAPYVDCRVMRQGNGKLGTVASAVYHAVDAEGGYLLDVKVLWDDGSASVWCDMPTFTLEQMLLTHPSQEAL
jgi:hypothetical protein